RVRAPARDRRIASARACGLVADRDLDRVVDALHFRRHGRDSTLAPRAVANLTVVVLPPAPHAAVLPARAEEPASSGDLLDLSEILHGDGLGRERRPLSVAELARVTRSETAHGAVVDQRARRVVADRKLLHRSEIVDAFGRRSLLLGAAPA